MRTLIQHDPYRELYAQQEWNKRGHWPCRWITCPDVSEPPAVCAYSLRFSLPRTATIRMHVSADERYELFLNGHRIGRGPERGDLANWFFETYDVPLDAGQHTLVARVWSLGEGAPFAQMSLGHAFLLSPQESEFVDLLGTGNAPWQAKKLGGYSFSNPLAAWGTGNNLILDARSDDFDWAWQLGEGNGWKEAQTREVALSAFVHNDAPPTRFLRPALLPPMLEEERHVGTVRHVAAAPAGPTHATPILHKDDIPEERAAWQQLVAGRGTIEIAPHTRRRVLIDLENYYCAYPEFTSSGGEGASLRIHWQESLYCEKEALTKGNRNEIEGKYFVTVWHLKDGIGDIFHLDGGSHRSFGPLWWQCGRYVEIVVETSEHPLRLEKWSLRETRYPFELESKFEASEKRFEHMLPIAWRTLQMCAHETYMDCPYYEQLMYIGDTRLETLTTYIATHDDRLPRKALALFDASRQGGGALPKGGFAGLTQSRYPTRVRQTIPPFSLWWVSMVHDFAFWRADTDFVRTLMPGVRGVVDYFLSQRNAQGLLESPNGWNYTDWVPAWKNGIPPEGDLGVSGILNWHLTLTLMQVAQLEELVGEVELATRSSRQAHDLASRTQHAFWDEERGLFADDSSKQHFSEHAQCLAILSGQLDSERRQRVAHGLLTVPDLARATIYFSHYLFEAFHATGNGQALLDRLEMWFNLEKQGFKTTFEQADPNTTRSDCHAWGAHPIYHAFASLLGIRPATAQFARVRIAPQLGSLSHAEGVMPHPCGEIKVALDADDKQLTAYIELPATIEGEFMWQDQQVNLRSGAQHFRLSVRD